MKHSCIRPRLVVAVLGAVLLFAHPLGAEEARGVAYVAGPPEAPLYAKSTGADAIAAIKPSAVLLGYHTWSGNGKEQVKDGRAHVKYYVNGRDSTGGEHVGWVAEASVTKFWFECCGTSACSGVEAKLGSFPLSQCVLKAGADVLARREQAGTSAQDLERLRLQLEIEKLKLEQERLKAQGQAQPNPSAVPSATQPQPAAPTPTPTPTHNPGPA